MPKQKAINRKKLVAFVLVEFCASKRWENFSISDFLG